MAKAAKDDMVGTAATLETGGSMIPIRRRVGLTTLAASFILIVSALADGPRAATPEQEIATEAPPALEAEGRATPPMWRLADEDSEIWLLGTFHILPPDLDWRSDPLAAAIDAADTLYFEAEVDTPEAQQKTLSTLMRSGFLPAGEKLSRLLSPAEAEKLEAVSAEVGLPFEAVNTMRPWQAFLNLTVQYIISRGFDPASGVETVLLKEARLRGRNLGFFETVEEQLALFTGLDRETELSLLRFTLEEWEAQDEQFNALFAAWRDGDAAAIDEMMNASMRDLAPSVYDALLVDRNKSWAEDIADIMAGRGRVLVAVGAGHLVGEKSVPAMLRAKGFDVERYGVE